MGNCGPSKDKIRIRNRVALKKRHWLRLTNFCNNNCIFCLDSGLHDGTSRSFLDIKKDLEKGLEEGAKKLIVSGGEPTVHPGFQDIIKLSRKMGYRQIQVITNGRMFCYPAFLKEAVKNGVTEITFSIHAHTQGLYEKISGVGGSYKQAISGLVNALGVKNLIINIDIVLTNLNYRCLEQILRFFIGLGVAEFDLLQVVPFGSAWKNRERVFYDLDKALPYLRSTFRLQTEFPDIYIWTNRFPPRYLEGFEELIQHPVKLYDEIRGRRDMFNRFISAGEKMPCFGKQCAYCFIKNFCRDLMELKENNNLYARRAAFCLEPGRKPSESFKSDGRGIDVGDFLNFYIKHRYFLKSLRCRACKYFDRCAGAPIDLIRKKGFAVLKPTK